MKKILFLLIMASITLMGCAPSAPQEKTENAVIEAIMARRSIRQYHATPVGRDTTVTSVKRTTSPDVSSCLKASV